MVYDMFDASCLRKRSMVTKQLVTQINTSDMDDYDDFDDYDDYDDFEDDLDFEIEHENDENIRVEHDIQYYWCIGARTRDAGYSVEVRLNGRWHFVDYGFDTFKEAYRAGQKYLRENR